MKTKIIGISGKKGSGKDYVAMLIRKYSGKETVRIAFADALKKQCARALNITVDEIEKDKKTYRTLLQWWGTDYRRNLFGDDYWIKLWIKAVDYVSENQPQLIIVTPDCRFENEVEAVHEVGGIVIRVEAVNVPSGCVDEHPSEVSLDTYKGFDCVINNDFKDHTVTTTQIQQILKKI